TVDAGSVKVNDIALDNNSNSYSKSASVGLEPSSLELSTGVKWSVGGSGSVTAFDYNYSGSFPDFDGTLATEIDKATGLDVSLGSDVSNADSVFVVIIDANGKMVSKSVKGNPAPAKVSFTSS